MSTTFSVLAIGCSLAAVLLLWLAWLRRDRRRGPLAAALVAWTAAIGCWVAGFGAEIGIPLALEATAIVAFAFILSRTERRQLRSVRERSVPVPPTARGRWRRGTLRAIGAGPLGFAAALGVGVVFATGAPLADSTRLILAGLLVPSLWAAAMIWVLASRRWLPPVAGLAGIAATTFGLSLMVAR